MVVLEKGKLRDIGIEIGWNGVVVAVINHLDECDSFKGVSNWSLEPDIVGKELDEAPVFGGERWSAPRSSVHTQ